MKPTWIFLVLITIPGITKSQDSLTRGNIVTNFKGIEFSYAYPKLTDRYAVLIKSDFGLGVKCGYSWGRYYPSGNALTFTPSFTFAYFGNTIFNHPYYKPKIASIHLQNLSLFIPGTAEIPLFKKLIVGAGLFMGFPLISTGKYNDRKIRLSFIPDFNKSDGFSYHPYAKIGFVTKVSFAISTNQNVKHILSLEYTHFLTYTDEANAHEKWLSLSYVRRDIFMKEKREKWDTYLIRKDEREQDE